MKKLKRAYKIEIDPTAEQKSKIHQTIGVSRFVYNFYIARNKEIYEREGKFVSGMDFSKWLNNKYIPNNQEMKWIKEVSSKATKQAIMNGDKSFRDFFKKAKGFPRFKKKKNQDVKAYFPKNNKTDWTIERHRVKIPTLGWIRLKEFGYIPVNSIVKSGTVSQKADRYYVSILVEENDKKVILTRFANSYIYNLKNIYCLSKDEYTIIAEKMLGEQEMMKYVSGFPCKYIYYLTKIIGKRNTSKLLNYIKR